MSYATLTAAIESLEADGYAPSSVPDSPYWVKRGMTHGWEPYERLSLAKPVEYRIDEEYGGGSYWEIRYD